MKRTLLHLILLHAILCSGSVWAGVTAERTRVIMMQDQREATLLLVNLNSYPVITQVWVDDGRPGGTPEAAQAPVMPLPPVFRLEPQESETLRLLFTEQNLPQDKESLYWLNIYEIPPLPTSLEKDEETLIAVTLQTQMKVILRPESLDMTLEQAAESISITNNGDQLKINNLSPYYLTLAYIKINDDTQGVLNLGESMLMPFSSQSFELPANYAATLIDQVGYGWIDDDGIMHQRMQAVKNGNSIIIQ